jgi:hypothetical protein
MDGFNIIPVEKDILKPASPENADVGIEIIDEEKEKKKQEEAAKSGSLLLILAYITLAAVLGYLGFLIFQRVNYVAQVISYNEQIVAIGKNIDLKEIEEFQTMDRTLTTVNSRLTNHVLGGSVMSLVNQNIRKNIQVSEYKLDVGKAVVEVSFTGTAPTFKDLAEQTERFFALKESGQIKTFAVNNLSFEANTKRIKFTLKVTIDQTKVNALNI